MTAAGKFYFIYLSCVVVFVLCCCKYGWAGEVNIHMDFAYNGTEAHETLGFRLYQIGPDGTETVVADIQDPDARTWDGTIPAVPGRSAYALTAYSATAESPKSAPYPFEYIEPDTSAMPAPTVVIRFN